MADADLKTELHEYLRDSRETLVWKLDGLGEYDIRRPMTPTGTNLIGLVKHSGSTHLRYFGEVFDRATDPDLSWLTAGAGPNSDLWATADESRDDVIDACRQAWALADATISEVPLDAPGRVPWWGNAAVTLHRVLLHVTAETQRHAGHADILRELIDGSAGLLAGFDNLQIGDLRQRDRFRDEVVAAARQASGEGARTLRFRVVDPQGPEAADVLRSYLREVSAAIPDAIVSEADLDDVDDFVAPRGRFLLATVDGKPSGGGALRLLDGYTAELKRMWIRADVRGTGLGAALLAELEQHAKGLGCTRVRLDTNHTLAAAVALYQRSGYHEIASYNDSPDADLWFEKQLVS
jgi:GNAT superfamily N-acetyltransferase